jgi:hypothetical protein
MTVEEAKTTLGICPPDDDTNPDVPGLDKALEMAARNPPLAAWWEQEKNFDLAFSRKLNSIGPPPELAATIMRGGATIFFASRLIAESTGENPDDDAALPEITPAEPILPRSAFNREVLRPETKQPRKPGIWVWRWSGLVIIVLLIIIGLLFAALCILPLFPFIFAK